MSTSAQAPVPRGHERGPSLLIDQRMERLEIEEDVFTCKKVSCFVLLLVLGGGLAYGGYVVLGQYSTVGGALLLAVVPVGVIISGCKLFKPQEKVFIGSFTVKSRSFDLASSSSRSLIRNPSELGLADSKQKTPPGTLIKDVKSGKTPPGTVTVTTNPDVMGKTPPGAVVGKMEPGITAGSIKDGTPSGTVLRTGNTPSPKTSDLEAAFPLSGEDGVEVYFTLPYPLFGDPFDIPAYEEMHATTQKADQQHVDWDLCAKVPRQLISLPENPAPLSVTFENGFKNVKNEDFYHSEMLPEGLVTLVFKGHEDQGKMAKCGGEKFPALFQRNLERANYNVKQAFEETFANLQIDEDMQALGKELGKGGFGGVVCFLDRNNLLYTATLGGDAAARCYERNAEDKTILGRPLSYMVTLTDAGDDLASTDENEHFRLITALENEQNDGDGKVWLRKNDYKHPCALGVKNGTEYVFVQNTRSVGDYLFRPGIITQTPEVTVRQVGPDTMIVLGSRGFWGNLVSKPPLLEDKAFISKVLEKHWEGELAKEILGFATRRNKQKEDVTFTVIAIAEKLNADFGDVKEGKEGEKE